MIIYPGFSLSVDFVCVLPRVHLTHSRLPHSSWLSLRFLFFRSSVVLSCDFIFLPLAYPWVLTSRVFQRLPSLGIISSVPMRCSFFSGCVDFVDSPSLSILFLWCPWFPFFSLSILFVTSLSFFRRSSDLVESPVPSATGSSLWAVSVPSSVLALFSG